MIMIRVCYWLTTVNQARSSAGRGSEPLWQYMMVESLHFLRHRIHFGIVSRLLAQINLPPQRCRLKIGELDSKAKTLRCILDCRG